MLFWARSSSRERRTSAVIWPPSGVLMTTSSGASDASPDGSTSTCDVSGNLSAARSWAGSTSTPVLLVRPSPGLARRAIVCGTATDYGAFDYGATRVTGLIGTAENLDIEVLAPRIPLSINVVAEARAAIFDPPLQHGAAGGEEAA